MNKEYLTTIVKHYEDCLETFGDTHKGVDWPKAKDVETRYQVMLDVIRYEQDTSTEISILDFGCGTAHLYEFIQKNKWKNLHYSGLDISDKFIAICRNKFNDVNFYCLDILTSEVELPDFDYVIMNGVFTEKRELSFELMWDYFCQVILKVFTKSNKGIAFNVMSKAVDWERDDLFHLSVDKLISFLTKNVSRNFVVRNNYGLYEYTVYVYR